MSYTGANQVVINLTEGLQLFIMPSAGGGHTASVVVGEWPSGLCITCTIFEKARVTKADEDEAPHLWLGDTAFYPSWLELLKVADFLRLDIPLPVPLGEQVPA